MRGIKLLFCVLVSDDEGFYLMDQPVPEIPDIAVGTLFGFSIFIKDYLTELNQKVFFPDISFGCECQPIIGCADVLKQFHLSVEYFLTHTLPSYIIAAVSEKFPIASCCQSLVGRYENLFNIHTNTS